VTTLHGTDITLLGLDSSFFEITRFSLEQSDGVTAVSDYLAQETIEKLKIDRPIETIYNFIDAERFTPEKRAESARGRFVCGDELLVGHLSNFRWVKRTADVVRIFHRIAQRVPARLVMAGDGPDLEATRGVADTLGILDRVQFLGGENEVENLLPQFDLFLLPSEQESFGLAALEAMACGVPVIATRVGGVPELVEEGVSGALFAVGDVEGMAAKAAGILASEKLRSQLSAGARARAVEFAEEKAIDHYEAYYRRVLGE
jgi:N-acetyl-alpha-D-glucosaminyl L-malate synthase BshA